MRFRLAFSAVVAAVTGITTAPQASPIELQLGIVNPSPNNNDLFGAALSLSGGKALIGATADGTTGTGSGRAYVYDSKSGSLLHIFENPTPATNDQFGGGVSVSGDLALIGAQNDALGGTGSGAAYLFDLTTGALIRTFANPGPTPNIIDNFGHSVAISGNRALVSAIGDDRGSSNAGAAYLFDTSTGALLQTFLNPTPQTGDNFGFDVALLGDRALISTINDDTAAMNAGAAYLFDIGTGALLHTFLNPTPELNNAFGNNDNFGFAVALSSTRLAIGAPNENGNGFHNGAVYLYDAATFGLLDRVVIPTPNSDTEEFLGSDVALSDDYLLSGAPFRNQGPARTQKDLGAAFVFDPHSGDFLQEIDDPVATSNDRFGFAVALDGDSALIGAQTDLVGTIRPGQVFIYQTPVAVPEPGTLVLVGLGWAGLWVARRRTFSPVALLPFLCAVSVGAATGARANAVLDNVYQVGTTTLFEATGGISISCGDGSVRTISGSSVTCGDGSVRMVFGDQEIACADGSVRSLAPASLACDGSVREARPQRGGSAFILPVEEQATLCFDQVPVTGSIRDGISNTILLGESTGLIITPGYHAPLKPIRQVSITDGTSNTIVFGEGFCLGNTDIGDPFTTLPTLDGLIDLGGHNGGFDVCFRRAQIGITDGTSNTILFGEAQNNVCLENVAIGGDIIARVDEPPTLSSLALVAIGLLALRQRARWKRVALGKRRSLSRLWA